MGKSISAEIVDALSHSPRGLSTQELASLTSVNRLTLAKYLHSMEQEGVVDHKNIGMAKLWFSETCPMLKTFASKTDSNIKRLFDSWNESIVVVDNNLNVVWVNGQYEKAIGERLAGLGGKDYAKLHAKKHGHEPAALMRALKTGMTERGMCETRNSRQITKCTEVTAFPMRDFKGNVAGAIAIGRDITEEKILEEDLMISEERNRFLIEHFTLPIVSIDSNHKVAEWNEAAEALFGYKKEEIIGKNFEKLVPEDKQEERKEFLSRLSDTNVVKDIRTVRLNKKGERIPVSINAFGINDEEGNLIWITGVLTPL